MIPLLHRLHLWRLCRTPPEEPAPVPRARGVPIPEALRRSPGLWWRVHQQPLADIRASVFPAGEGIDGFREFFDAYAFAEERNAALLRAESGERCVLTCGRQLIVPAGVWEVVERW